MTHRDSLKFSLTRRHVLGSALGAGAWMASPALALAATPPGFDQWR